MKPVRWGWSCLRGARWFASSSNKAFLEKNAGTAGVTTLPSGLQYRVVASGETADAPSPSLEDLCECHYEGKLIDGTVFESSHGGAPSKLVPGNQIKGLAEALTLMKQDDHWHVSIPPELGYGSKDFWNYRSGAVKIPAESVLQFEIELLGFKRPNRLTWLAEPVNFAGLVVVVALAAGLYHWYSGRGARGPMMTAEQAAKPDDPRVFMDIEIGGRAAGRLELQLFHSVCPKTTENFRMLCTAEKGLSPRGVPLAFQGSTIHRVIPGFMAQGGDFTRGDGTGGESVYGDMFDDEFEGGVVRHSQAMLLSMANAGRNTNGSQFFLTTAPTPHLDGRHVVFGRVVAGEDVVRQIEAVGSPSGATSRTVRIASCGQLP